MLDAQDAIPQVREPCTLAQAEGTTMNSTTLQTEYGFSVSRIAPLSGRYVGELVSLDHCDSKFTTELQLRWSFQLTSKQHEGETVTGYTPTKFVCTQDGQPLSKAANWASACLGGEPLPDGDLNPNSLYGKKVTVVVESKFSDDGQTFRNKVVNVLPAK